jgi:putative endonuclease
VTNDLVRRVHEHKSGDHRGFTKQYGDHRGFTKQYDVTRLVWFETYDDPENAILREKDIKKWRRSWKLRLIEESNSQWLDLYDCITQ